MIELRERQVGNSYWFQLKNDHGEPVATAIASQKDLQTVYLDSIHVYPKERRQGYATRLLEQVKCWARSWGATKIEGDFVPEFRGEGEKAAREFYAKHGIEIDQDNKLSGLL